MLKFFLVAHLTYENQWVSLRNKIQTFGFFGTPQWAGVVSNHLEIAYPIDNLNIEIDYGGDETDDHGNDDPDEGGQEARPP